MSKSEQAVLWVLGGLGLFLLILLSSALNPPRRYKLPTGKIVSCSSFEETRKGNYVLKDCEDGVTYYTNGTIEELP